MKKVQKTQLILTLSVVASAVILIGCENKVDKKIDLNISSERNNTSLKCPTRIYSNSPKDEEAYSNLIIKPKELQRIIQKANNGDIRALSIIARYYEYNANIKNHYDYSDCWHFKLDKARDNFRAKIDFEENKSKDVIDLKKDLEKYAFIGDVDSQKELRWTNQDEKLLKKWHIEYLVLPETIYMKLLNIQKIEYRDYDPRGVFFDENGSVIKYE